MKSKDVKQKVLKVIREYNNVLENTAKQSFGIPESSLPYSKKAIKNAIKLALVMIQDEAQKEQLKISYISLANFITDVEAKKTAEIPTGLFPFLEMDEQRKKKFLKERYKSGLLGDYEQANKITKKIGEEQKRLSEEIEEFLKKN
jgi:hypothetical protein